VLLKCQTECPTIFPSDSPNNELRTILHHSVHKIVKVSIVSTSTPVLFQLFEVAPNIKPHILIGSLSERFSHRFFSITLFLQ
jgi:hypothetical protein